MAPTSFPQPRGVSEEVLSGKPNCYEQDTKGDDASARRGMMYYVATDQVGTPRVVFNAAGVVVKEQQHDSFGRLQSDSAPSFELPVGFAGGLVDDATGLVQFGLRSYDPSAGRWTARDPALFRGRQMNLYTYVGNNPIRLMLS
jgi:RHS repeat-associated protein